MALITCTTQKSGQWSDPTVWDNVPGDRDNVVVGVGHQIWMDVDMSAWTYGLGGLTFMDDLSTPPMLYFKDGASGHLKISYKDWVTDEDAKIKVYSSGYGHLGPLAARILINANGSWDSIYPLSPEYTAVIELVSEGAQSAELYLYGLDIRAFASEPAIRYLEPYGERFDFMASPATVSTTQYWIRLPRNAPPHGTPVRIKSLGGAIPSPLREDVTYYVYEPDGQYCYLSTSTISMDIPGGAGALPVSVYPIETTGSGAVTLYTGHMDLNNRTMNVFDDVSSDDEWAVSSGLAGRLEITNSGMPMAGLTGSDGHEECQLTHIQSKGTNTITISDDPANYYNPGARIWLLYRNVAIVATGSCTQRTLVRSSGEVPDTILNCLLLNESYHYIETDINGNYGYRHMGGGDGMKFDGIMANFGGRSITAVGTIGGVILGSPGATASIAIYGCDGGVTSEIWCCVNGIQGATSFSGSIYSCDVGIYVNDSGDVYDGTIIGCRVGVAGTGSPSFEYLNTIRLDIAGCRYGTMNLTGGYSGSVENCDTAHYQPSGLNGMPVAICGEITRCYSAFYGGTRVKINGATINYCVYVFDECNGDMVANNMTLLWNLIEYTAGTGPYPGRHTRQTISYNHDQVAGAIAAWDAFYNITCDASVHPASSEFSHKMTFTMPLLSDPSVGTAFMEWDILGGIGGTFSVDLHTRHDTTGLLVGDRVHWELYEVWSDPRIDSDFSTVESYVADDVSGWQYYRMTFTKSADQQFRLRVWSDKTLGYAHVLPRLVGGDATVFGIVGLYL